MTKRVFIIAGEASGDFLGAGLIQSLKNHNLPLEISGIGGEQMAGQGLESIFPMAELSLFGLFEILPHLRRLLQRIRQTKAALKDFKPDVLVTIDSPGFCLKIAKYAKQIGIPVVHYVAPSVWAWRPGRAKKLAKKIGIDHLLCLLPFEPPYFTCHGLPATFVGHPITELDLPDDSDFRKSLGIDLASTLVCLLPGSRKSEIEQMLNIFLQTCQNLASKRPIEVVLPTLEHLVPIIQPLIERAQIPVKVVTTPALKWQAFMQSSIALAASGTVSLELAFVGVPQVIAYKVSKLTHFIAKRLVKTKYVSLVNILSEKAVVPECLQENCDDEILLRELEAILGDSARQKIMRQNYAQVLAMLRVHQAKASDVAAVPVINLAIK